MSSSTDSKLSQLTLRSSPESSDLLYLVVPGDSDPDRKIPLSALAPAIHATLEAAAAPEANDSEGTPGQWFYESGILYQCVAPDTWVQTLVADTFDNS
ncbi:MAG: hypothetical protein ACQKBU_04480 [Verrucomicrobiales bacterium]